MHALHDPSLRAIASVAATLCLCASLQGEGNLLANAGFETGDEQWSLYCGKEAEDAGAAIAASGEAARSGSQSLRLSCPQTARYSAGPFMGPAGKVTPGDRYKLSVWVLAGNDFVKDPGTQGFVVRATLRTPERVDSPDGHFFFIPPNRAVRAKYGDTRAALGPAPVLHEWRLLAAVFEIPAGVGYLGLNFFVENGSGALFIDDVELLKVDDTTPLTPLLP